MWRNRVRLSSLYTEIPGVKQSFVSLSPHSREFRGFHSARHQSEQSLLFQATRIKSSLRSSFGQTQCTLKACYSSQSEIDLDDDDDDDLTENEKKSEKTENETTKQEIKPAEESSEPKIESKEPTQPKIPESSNEADSNNLPIPPIVTTTTAATTKVATATEDANPPPVDKKKMDKRIHSLAVSNFLIGLSTGALNPILPLILAGSGINGVHLGVVMASLSVARLMTNIPAGWLAERYGRRQMIVYGPVLSAVGFVALGATTGMPNAIAARSVTGVGGAVESIGGNLYISDITTEKNRGKTMAYVASTHSIGLFAGPLVIGFLALSESYTLYSIGGMVLTAAIWNAFFIKETKRVHQVTKTKKLGNPDKVNNIESNIAQAQAPPQGFSTQLKIIFRQWGVLWALPDMKAIFFLQTTFLMIPGYCIFASLPLICSGDPFFMSATDIGMIFSAIGLGNIIFTYPAGWISDRWGRKSVLVPSAILCAASAILIPLAQSTGTLYGAIVLYGIAAGLYSSNGIAYVNDIATENSKAQATALVRSGADIGVIVGSVLGPAIASLTDSITYPFWISASLLLAAGLNFALRASESIPKRPAKSTPKLSQLASGALLSGTNAPPTTDKEKSSETKKE